MHQSVVCYVTVTVTVCLTARAFYKSVEVYTTLVSAGVLWVVGSGNSVYTDQRKGWR